MGTSTVPKLKGMPLIECLQAVEELPTQMRNIILYSMKGLKNHEIADKLQISEGTVHTLKKFAYRKLRESLKGINYTLLLFLCK